MAEETTKIDLGDYQLRYRSIGAGERTLVLLHGFVDTIDVWEKLVPEVSALGRIVLLELRGHGWSGAPQPPFEWESLVADVVQSLDLLDIEKATLVGHSIGGVVALVTASVAPERAESLVILGTRVGSNDKEQRWIDEIVKSGQMNGREGLAHAIWGPMSTRKIEGQPVGMTEVARLIQRLGSEPLLPRLASITTPVLAVAGSEDPAWPAGINEVVDAIDGAEIEVIEGADHWPHLGKAPETGAAIRRFVRGVA